MTAPSNWKAINSPMNEQLNETLIEWMVHKVTCHYTGEAESIDPPVFMLEREKDFKYGKGKEIIAFTDGGKNKFGKDIKYVKFFSLYESSGKLKPMDKTYTFGVDKSRTFWDEKIADGYNRADDKTIDTENKSGYVDENGNLDPTATVGNYQAETPNGEKLVDVNVVEPT